MDRTLRTDRLTSGPSVLDDAHATGPTDYAG